jgi:hypothetical protein
MITHTYVHRFEVTKRETAMRLQFKGLLDGPTKTQRYRQEQIYKKALRKISLIWFKPSDSRSLAKFKKIANGILETAYVAASRYSVKHARLPVSST